MSEKVRITFEVPKTLVEFIDKECKRKSTEVMNWKRSSYLRQLIIEARDGKIELEKSKQIQKEDQQNNELNGNDYFDDLLNVSGYKK